MIAKPAPAKEIFDVEPNIKARSGLSACLQAVRMFSNGAGVSTR